MIKQCIKCGLKSDNFYYDKKRDVYSSSCRSCEAKKRRGNKKREYRKINKEEINRKKREDRKNNPGKYAAYDRKYRNRIQERRNERQMNDPKYRLVRNLEKYYARHGGKALYTTMRYTGKDLCNHIENLFEPWMNWDNYGCGEGCWCIDHKIALKNGGTWELDNLQPLCFMKNSLKDCI